MILNHHKVIPFIKPSLYRINNIFNANKTIAAIYKVHFMHIALLVILTVVFSTFFIPFFISLC
jgi:hypothetical protein